MKRITRFISSLVVASVFMMLTGTSSALAHHTTTKATFGTEPLADVRRAAEAYRPSGFSVDEWAAIVLAVTWPEVAANNIAATPSPLTLGRSDITKGLYSWGNNSTFNPYKRAFWHAGVGAWQLDPSGLGMSYDAEDAVNTARAAMIVAAAMKSRWESPQNTGTAADKRAYTWAPWFACGGNKCETIYQHIWTTGPNGQKFLEIAYDPSTTSRGGGEMGSCTFSGQSTTWWCFRINVQKAEGYTSWWSDATVDGSYYYGPNNTSGILRDYKGEEIARDMSPLGRTFYVTANSGYEYRYFPASLSGYNKSIRGYRPFTSDARNSLTWQDSTEVLFTPTSNPPCCPH